MHDLKNGFPPTLALTATAKTLTDAVANGETVNLAEAIRALIVATVGPEGDTLTGSLYLELALEHSDDGGSTWDDCLDEDVIGAVTALSATTGTFAVIDSAADANKAYSAAYIGAREDVRVVVNAVGTHTTGTVVGASWALEQKYKV